MTILVCCSQSPILQAATPVHPQQSKGVIEKEGLLRALRKKALTELVLVREVEERGVSFRPTPSDETEIRQAGSYLGRGGLQKLLAAVRSNYRPPVRRVSTLMLYSGIPFPVEEGGLTMTYVGRMADRYWVMVSGPDTKGAFEKGDYYYLKTYVGFRYTFPLHGRTYLLEVIEATGEIIRATLTEQAEEVGGLGLPSSNLSITSTHSHGDESPPVAATRSKRVLLLIDETVDGKLTQDEGIVRALSKRLADSGLSVSTASQLSADELLRVKRQLQIMQGGEGGAGYGIPFGVVVAGSISATRTESLNGVYSAAANGSLQATDAVTGMTVAVETINSTAGYGSTWEQAAYNALARASASISDSFIERVSSKLR